MKKVRVLISSPDLSSEINVSGISSVVKTIINGLSEKVQFFHLKAGRPDKDVLGLFGYMQLLRTLLGFPFVVYFYRIELFHQNVPLNFKGVIREYLFNNLARMYGIPILVHLHGGDYLRQPPSSRILRYMIRSLLNGARKVLVLNNYEASQTKRLYQINSLIMKNAVDEDFYSHVADRSMSDKVRFLFLGRLIEEKGLFEMINAFEILKETGKSFKLGICGSGPCEAEIVKRFTEVLGDDFEFKGVVSGVEKRDVIQSSDFFLLPSYFSEGLPMSLLEAMSCGVVPIVSDDESMLQVIKDGSNGFIVQKRSVVDLAKTLGRMMFMEHDEYRKVSLACRKAVEVHYSMKNYSNSLLSIYEEIV